jgi:IS4 transposase
MDTFSFSHFNSFFFFFFFWVDTCNKIRTHLDLRFQNVQFINKFFKNIIKHLIKS